MKIISSSRLCWSFEVSLVCQAITLFDMREETNVFWQPKLGAARAKEVGASC